ncbi:hypothetical protein SAMN04488063_1750 [Halopelagius inordinatus]|uniref:DUF8101 domain-containing protein n=1 Tax=Halopelagius inordinatus TaxID=553467 RepID=A0A1I2R1F2_9EURY|nr:hypothetical protein [Halopelagius inordinatus]SFG34494.1 hypothetical protein SAMN04488063_1750 [Halopelagius inordinatus]
MSDELPPDVRATLTQLLESAAEDARTRDADSVRDRLRRVETVTDEEVPGGSGKERLRHGVRQVRRTVETEPLVAAEYLASMRRLVEDEGGAGEPTDDGDENGDADSDESRDADST